MTFGLELALVLAVLIGLSLGMLGGGGAIVTLPVLVYVAGIPPHKAGGMSVAVVGATNLIGSFVQYLCGHLHRQATFLLPVAELFLDISVVHQWSELVFYLSWYKHPKAVILPVHGESRP